MKQNNRIHTPKGLNFFQKAGYGAAEIGIVSIEVIIQIYLLKFYTSNIGLKSELTGLALGLAVFVDAVTDPIMGTVSDQTGNKRLFMLIGSFAILVTFPFLFDPPLLKSSIGQFFFLFMSYSLVNIATTLLAVPHAALGAELTQDPHERNLLYGFRLGFGNIGFLLGTFLPGIFLLTLQGREGSEFAYTGYSVAFLGWMAGIISCLATRQKSHWVSRMPKAPTMLPKAPTDVRQIVKNLFHSVMQLKSNYFFISLLLAFFIATVGRTINSSVAIYYYKNYLGLSENQIIFHVLGTFILFISISIPIWVQIAKRFGKKKPAAWGIFLLGVMTCIVYPMFPKYSLTGPIIAGIFGGFLVSSILLLDSLVADMSDYDAKSSQEKKEGLYFGFWKFATKVSRAFGLVLAGFLLNLVGFQEGLETQTPQVNFYLSIIFGPIVGFFFISGALILKRIPWNEDIHKKSSVA